MNHSLEENRIPVKGLLAGYIVTVALLFGFLFWAFASRSFMFAQPQDLHARLLLIFSFAAILAPLFLFALIGIWFFIYQDAGRRGMNRWLWTLIAIFTPNLIGIILYLILRRPLLTPCPGCGSRVEPQLLYCPGCGSQLKRRCPACNAGLEPGSQFCGTCGTKLEN